MAEYKPSRIPKNLEECHNIDKGTEKLLNWSSALETWAKALLSIILCFGGLAAVGIAADAESFGLFLTIGGSVVAAAFVTYFSLYIPSLFISALAHIAHNTKVSAKVSLYTAAKAEGYEEPEKNIPTPFTNKSI